MKGLFAKHKAKYRMVYEDKPTGKSVIVEKGDGSDGATGAFDIFSESWWIHDELCKTGKWSDGTPVTNFQASRVLATILMKEQRFFRAFYWGPMTFLFGCKKARENGMFWLKNK